MEPQIRPPVYREQNPVPEAKPAPADEEPPLFIVRRQFPRIAEAIELMWGERELDGYLNKLILADRSDREGFPKPMLQALLKLHNQHTSQFHFRSREDEWAVEDRVDRVKGLPYPR
jgi:hypothetical protein